MKENSYYSFQRAFWIVLAITALRILYLAINHRDLDVEESQYWTWSQYLSFGYHSKPPLISWTIHLSTWLFGNSEWGIRLFSPICYLLCSLFIYKIGELLFSQAVGFWSALTLSLLPGVAYSSTLISTDPLLLLFWTIALYYFIQALKTEKLPAWIACGFAVGLGLLSKYTMMIFFLSAGLYLLLSSNFRPNLLKKGPYLAVAIAVLIFLPNLIWNHSHQNVALHHVIGHNIYLHGLHWHNKALFIFIISQFGILGPLLMIFFIIALFRVKQFFQEEENKLLLCFSLPILILIIGESILSRAYGNWAATAYPSALVFIVAFLYKYYPIFWLKLTNAMHVITIFIFCCLELAIAYGWSHWPTSATPNWQDYGNLIAQLHQPFNQSGYLVDSRELWSKSIYYGNVSRNNLYVWDPKHKISWVDNPAHLDIPIGKDFILLTHRPGLRDSMSRAFTGQLLITEISVNQRLRGHQDRIYIYWLQNFKGYVE